MLLLEDVDELVVLGDGVAVVLALVLEVIPGVDLVGALVLVEV